ncbi:glycosyltransferase [Pedobacter glucosidilyticus]|uniref:glycosyltransferase n=1 Tax=Pedobacter glucosidilyticus TaxID=1122941 RepID=UPI00040C37C0|nr:glycosyltransferase [Pedobacter glucosidilyticus]
MKILHITASYKPAYVYGGPVMSVAKLCEEVQAESERLKAESERLKAESRREDVGNQKTGDGRPRDNRGIDVNLMTISPKTEDRSLTTHNSEHTTDNLQPRTISPKTADRSLATDNSELTTDNLQPRTISPKTADRGLGSDSETFLENEGFDSAQPDKMIVSVYTTLANGKEELPYQNGETKMVDGVEVTYFKRITKDHSHLSPALLWHLWKTVKQFDVVHIHAWWNLVSMPACLIALCRGVKVVLSPRGTLSLYSFEKDKSLLKKVFHQLLGKHLLNACYFHTTSAKEAIDTQALLKPKTIFNIPNFVNLPWEKSFIKKEKNDGVLKLIFLSRIEEKKGLELLFKVLKTLDFAWELSIVGEGEVGYVERLKLEGDGGPKTGDRGPKTEDRGPRSEDGRLGGERQEIVSEDGIRGKELTKRIHWLGPVYGDEKFDLMAAHDVFILPSYDENFANVVIESLYTGTPVAITENVGLSDYVKEKNLGWVCKREAADLKTSLQKAYQDILNKKMQPERLQYTIRNDFKERNILKHYQAMYMDLSI